MNRPDINEMPDTPLVRALKNHPDLLEQFREDPVRITIDSTCHYANANFVIELRTPKLVFATGIEMYNSDKSDVESELVDVLTSLGIAVL